MLTGETATPSTNARERELEKASYEFLAKFRYEVRRFFQFSEAAIKAVGLTSAHYSAMLAIRVHPGSQPISVGELAAQLFIEVHSASELVARMEKAGLVERRRSRRDARRSHLALTAAGDRTLADLAALHLAQHKKQIADFQTIFARLATTPDPAGG